MISLRSGLHTIPVFLLIVVAFSQLNFQSKLLNLIDDIVPVSASGGNISPTETCTSGSYSGATTPYTASNVNITIPLNSAHYFSPTDFASSFTPTLPSGVAPANLCVQYLPSASAGVLEHGGLPISPGYYFQDVSSRPVLDGSLFRFSPQTGFVGTACFDVFIQLNDTSGPSMDTNVISVALQIGGSTATCTPTGTAPTMDYVNKTGYKNADVFYTQSDFLSQFNDIDSDTLISIDILTLPNIGTLSLNNSPVNVGDTILLADLGNLKFTPPTNFTGYVSYQFIALDSGFNSSLPALAQIIIDNRAPIVTPISKSGPLNTAITFSLSDFTTHFSDPDGDQIGLINIVTLPSNGVLKYNNVPLTSPDSIDSTSFGSLVFEPSTGFSGSTSFDWQATDGCTSPPLGYAPNLFDMIFGSLQVSAESCLDSNISQVNITINPSDNPAPTMTGQTIVIKKTQSGNFSAFVATDPNNNTPITFTTSTINSQLNCTQSNVGQVGNIITCNPDISLPVGQYSFQVTPIDSLSASGQPVTFTVDLQNPSNVIIDVSKSKPNEQIALNDTVTIQGDITNPNPFPLSNVTTDFTIDTTKVNLVSGSGQEGQIGGTKYAALEMIKKLFILDAQAASGAVITYPSAYTVRVFLPVIPANTTFSYTFNVQSQNVGVGLITGNSTVQGLSLPSASDQTSVGTVSTTSSLPRTGGQSMNVILVIFLAGLLAGILTLIKPKNRRSVPVVEIM